MVKLHAWDLSPQEGMRVQAALRQRLKLTWDGRTVASIGGVDVSLPARDEGQAAAEKEANIARCAIVVLSYPDLRPLEAALGEAPLVFPYIPGLLAFREGPAVLAAWDELQHQPDLLIFDGQGIAHPRGMGIAAQMGLWLERPTIGAAKSRLYGRHATLGPQAGAQVELYDEQNSRQIIGAVLRTRDNTNPIYVSPGHLMDIEHAVEFVLACCQGYRLPEPTRWAHRVAGGEKFEVDNQPRLF